MSFLNRSPEKKVHDAPAGFFVIGIAVGMVLMTILFRYFEPAIKSWGGYSWAHFPLLAVYLGITVVIWRKFNRDFRKLFKSE